MGSVVLEEVTKRYGETVAVRSFDLAVADQEFVALLGPSGCGKSTTLRMIAGLEEITSGEIRIGEVTVNDLPPRERDIAMVFQNYALFPHMTVRENMSFGLKLAKTPRSEIDARVTDAAKTLGMAQKLDRRPAQLSGGERQRVAMGRAMVRRPKVFLFDEPLSNLDAQLRTSMRTEIKRLHRQLGTTIIYVTHDQIEAMTLADRIVIMRNGLIEQVGTPFEVFAQPASIFVASFIGAPPMNFFDAEITEAGALEIGDGLQIPIPEDRFVGLSAGRQVTLGLRAEDIVPHGHGRRPGRGWSFTKAVSFAEPLGSESLLILDIAGRETVSKMYAAVPVAPGEELGFDVNLDGLHLFDDEGRSLAR